MQVCQSGRLGRFLLSDLLSHDLDLHVIGPQLRCLVVVLVALHIPRSLVVRYVVVVIPDIMLVVDRLFATPLAEPRTSSLFSPMSFAIPYRLSADEAEVRPTFTSHMVAPFAQLHPSLASRIGANLPLPTSLQAIECSLLHLTVLSRITLMFDRCLRASNICSREGLFASQACVPHTCFAPDTSAMSRILPFAYEVAAWLWAARWIGTRAEDSFVWRTAVLDRFRFISAEKLRAENVCIAWCY